MEIIEKNLRIKFTRSNYSVLKKVKKKKDSTKKEDTYKVIGHYITIYFAIFTLHSYLPKTESKQLKQDLVKLKKSIDSLQNVFEDINERIENLKTTIIQDNENRKI